MKTSLTRVLCRFAPATLALIAVGCGGSGGGVANEVSQILVTKTVAGNTDVYFSRLDGTSEVRLTTDAAIDGKAKWSADGAKIVFVREQTSGAQSVWVMNEDGSGQTELTPGLNAFDPRWIGNAKIVYASGTGTASEIYSMNADGTGKTRLTNDSIGDVCPSASPNGATVAYMKAIPGLNGTHEIWLMNTDGSNQRLLVGGLTVGSLAWSPDGSKVAYVSDRTGNKDIFVINVDGTSDTQLTTNAGNDFSVLWPSSGNSLIFASDRDGNNEVYTMNLNGTNQTRKTSNSTSDIPTSWRLGSEVF